MSDLKYVTYCDFTAGSVPTSPHSTAGGRPAADLRKDGWELFGESLVPGFSEFWAVRERLSQSDQTCRGCRGGCGDPLCSIRQCAQEKSVEVCSSCAEYPCSRIEHLAARYPNLISDGTRQRQIGLGKWVEEQNSAAVRASVTRMSATLPDGAKNHVVQSGSSGA